MSSNHTLSKQACLLLIGSGIGKSLSPEIQNKLIRLAGMNARYELLDIKTSSAFRKNIRAIKNDPDNIVGFNVTVPYKEKIIPFLEAIEGTARKIGAVNTVKVLSFGALIGYNTDINGIKISLKNLGLSKTHHSSCIILGAGGAARACAFVLAQSGFNLITFFNRTVKRAKSIAANFQKLFPKVSFTASNFDEEKISQKIEVCDLLVNCISKSTEGFFPIPLEFMENAKRGMKVFDLGYQKTPSLFLRTAISRGFRTIDGLPMLREQARRSFEIWFNTRAAEL